MLASLAFVLSLQGTVTSDAALAKMRAAFQGHRAAQGTFTFRSYDQTGTGRFAYLAPGYFLVQTGNVRVVGDGTKAFRFFDVEKYYVELANAAQKPLMLPGFGLVLEGTPATQPGGEAKVEKVGEEEVVAVPTVEPGAPDDFQGYVLVSTRTWLPKAVRGTRLGKVTEEYVFDNVVLDPPLKPEDFSLAIPAGYQNLNSTSPTPAPAPTPPAPAPKPVELGFRRVPGQWADAAAGSIAVSFTIGTAKVNEKPHWTFLVKTKGTDGYHWKKAVVQAHVPAGWRKGVLIGKTKDGYLFGVEKREAKSPDALSLTLPATSADYPAPFRFGFDWKPLSRAQSE